MRRGRTEELEKKKNYKRLNRHLHLIGSRDARPRDFSPKKILAWEEAENKVIRRASHHYHKCAASNRDKRF